MTNQPVPSEAGSGSSTLFAPLPTAVPATVQLFREKRGLKVKELADLVDVNASYLSKIENGKAPLSGTKLAEVAAALQVGETLLCREIPAQGIEGAHFRSQTRTPQWRRRKVVADANVGAFLLNNLLEAVDASFPRDLPDLDVALLAGGAAEAAALVRTQWRIQGPVTHLAEQLEAAGVYLLDMDPAMQTMDAVTVRSDGAATAVMMVRGSVPEDRKRHTIAHELAHLVMDLRSPHTSAKDIEERADIFAGEFLAPYAEIREDLIGITPAQMDIVEGLQAYWGVSIPSLIRRAYLHQDINETQYRYWFRVLNAQGLRRKNQPSSYPVNARGVREVVLAARDDGFNVAGLMALTDMTLPDLEETLGHAWPYPRIRARLQVVPGD